ncbi:unnamed protein product [Linum tenue]|uniref:Glycosyltransferase n=1 Tax=Linum tenue TaxID=586396 RepID=A0AAV0KLH7_9ROSI|nr:unnamed protein product [Linum tenue]
MTTKPHAVLVPFPAQGHLSPFLQLAKLLHSRGFHITYVNNEFNHNRLLQSKGEDFVNGLPDFKFVSFPDGLPPSDEDATQSLDGLSSAARKTMLGPFRELVAKLNASPDSPPVSCIIPDGFMCFGLKAAEELGILGVPFWTASACGFKSYFHYVELIEKGLIPHKKTPIDWMPGLREMRLYDLPYSTRTTSPDEILLNCLRDETQECVRAAAIIMNTFHDFEQEVLDAIKAINPNVYCIGPLNLLEARVPAHDTSRDLTVSLWKEDPRCFEWLDKQKPGSVVYVNYGSIAKMSEGQFREFAWGLATCGHPFIWVVRTDVMRANAAVLTEDYYKEIEDRALIVTWCQQEQVLAHEGVGLFFTHAGWNSTLETVIAGKPVICWPFIAEQSTNSRYLCKVWDVGVEASHHVTRGEIVELIKEMLESERGKERHNKALEWKEKAVAAAQVGGSSYKDFDRLIAEVFRH